jgi:hypothetical protein
MHKKKDEHLKNDNSDELIEMLQNNEPSKD